jgi:hypothetical protein
VARAARGFRTQADLARLIGLVAVLAVVAGGVGSAGAKVFYAQDEALRAAFPEAETFDKQTFVLTDERVRELEALARAKFDSRIITVHVGKRGQQILGYAMIDIHTVRTQPEAVMVVLSPEGQVESELILAFHEPLDYLPTNRWMKQFEKKTLTPDLALGQGIAAITGATLSAQGVTNSARRALAVYQLMLAPKQR